MLIGIFNTTLKATLERCLGNMFGFSKPNADDVNNNLIKDYNRISHWESKICLKLGGMLLFRVI